MKKTVIFTSMIWILIIVLWQETIIILSLKKSNTPHPVAQPSINTQSSIPTPIPTLPYNSRNAQYATSLTLTQTYEGTISTIGGPGDMNLNKKVSYTKIFELKNSNNDTFIIYFFEGYTNLAKVFERVNNVNKPITLESLKVGDHIQIESVTDIRKEFPNNLKSLTITKN